ncbi:restriction endonuclease [Mariprofundus erugo]|uniref:Restriction endonuclease n=1 Tax=Mariprofundus erugo TaxID=2528639 RepID=A0A5R9GSS1_9PROT|nr:restriction endonuclease [Mariprofundus erugo]TLS66284.1 restriction endonuclease [Mariprofundus erugo]
MSLVTHSDVEPKYTSTGRQSGWMIELRHNGLNETRHLSASEISILQGKVNNQLATWEKKYARVCDVQDKKDKEEQAQERTAQAKEALEAIENILSHTLGIDDAVDWNDVKNTQPFKTAKPRKPNSKPIPSEPSRSSFMKPVPFMKTLFGQKQKIVSAQEAEYAAAIEQWRKDKSAVESENAAIVKAHEKAVAEWNDAKAKYEAEQVEFNAKIEQLRAAYGDKNAEAIVEYCEMVLNNSEYPDSFPKDFEIQYNEANGMLLIDYQLPSIENIPNLTVVKYVKSRDEFDEKYLAQSARERLFDSAVYQITLRTIHEILEADVINAISSVTFNGIVTAVNPATGNEETKCILSLQAAKEEFCQINLGSVDPKTCFKALKGVGSSKLSSITPVRPILELDKSDKRFRDHYEVAGGMDESTNLAAMPWEDFEHLVRELFEKEFAANGGEVKVTQASADGGVDAVAFDPDPIRGGKIVIQAKRYTNTVGVAAVRDLYGTVMNEGATKGILVTTSDYGPDSYEFAKGKPLTLLSGGNLLHLLEKHGHSAKIDIKEAKLLMKNQ